LRRAVSQKLTEASDVIIAIALMTEAVNTCETLVDFYEITWRSILESCHLRILILRASNWDII
jgi:hypothetical protein